MAVLLAESEQVWAQPAGSGQLPGSLGVAVQVVPSQECAAAEDKLETSGHADV